MDIFLNFKYKRKTKYLPNYKIYLTIYSLNSENIGRKYILGFEYRDIIKYLYNNKEYLTVFNFLYANAIYSKFFLLPGVNYCKIYIQINIYSNKYMLK